MPIGNQKSSGLLAKRSNSNKQSYKVNSVKKNEQQTGGISIEGCEEMDPNART